MKILRMKEGSLRLSKFNPLYLEGIGQKIES